VVKKLAENTTTELPLLVFDGQITRGNSWSAKIGHFSLSY